MIPAAECIFRKGLLRGVTMLREDDFTSSDRAHRFPVPLPARHVPRRDVARRSHLS
ncbi:protein of unknown function (plasmid) [Paraburkholderia dioscoreae]|uniref:Uncharacterized protein n=1 Tax=Paraburkholderia dioscoreae TaxID=2604047 RepID=A0A5Q4ZR53_9BURK|nr:protein of unknown function [Paraburkholderia dioscoreae]